MGRMRCTDLLMLQGKYQVKPPTPFVVVRHTPHRSHVVGAG